MKTQHTPGPWHVLIEDEDGEFTTRTILSSGNKQRNLSEVALCTTGSFDDETEAANARLIAAAPDLLETLGKVASHLRGLYGGHDGASEVDIYNVVVRSMDKAKGL